MVSLRKGLSSYEKKYDAKLSKLYQIIGRADVQYSRRAQTAQIQEKTNIIKQCSFMKAINCGQILFFHSFSLLITPYYSVWFPYLLTWPYRDPCNAF